MGQTQLTENNKMNDLDFYDKIAEDIKQTHIQFVSEAGHGKTSSLRTIIDHCKRKHPDLVFKIFDLSLAWFHCAPTKYRQLVTVERYQRGLVKNIDDCTYEIGTLDQQQQREFVAGIMGADYKTRYELELNEPDKLDELPFIVYICEESNIYFGSYALRKNDWCTHVFQKFVSVGRNFKMRSILIATAEEGEMSPSLRDRTRKIYGRIISQRDYNKVKRSDKTLANYLRVIPRFNFVYVAEKVYGPVRIPDLVTNVPEDYVPADQDMGVKANHGWWIRFFCGLSISVMVALFLRYFKVI